MKKLSRFIVLAVFAISMVFASGLSARAGFVVMDEWQEQAYLFDTLEGGGASPFTFNVWAFVEYDNDPGSGTFNQYRYNYWVHNLDDGIGGSIWQQLEIRLLSEVIAFGIFDGGPGNIDKVGIDAGLPSGRFPGMNVFYALADARAGVPQGGLTDTFWLTTYASPGAGLGAGEGDGVPWVYGNPGTGRLPAPVPEPGTMALLGMGIVGIGFLKRARRKNSQNI